MDDHPVGLRRTITAIRVLFATGAVAHLALVAAQPILAGWSLDGDGAALDLHGINGSIILTIAMILIPLGALAWRPGRGTVWAPVLAAAVFTAETFQLGMGYADILVLHVPLGVAIVIASIGLAATALPRRPAPRKART